MDDALNDDAGAFDPIEKKMGPFRQGPDALAILRPKRTGLRMLGQQVRPLDQPIDNPSSRTRRVLRDPIADIPQVIPGAA